jgi:hypothetical protein
MEQAWRMLFRYFIAIVEFKRRWGRFQCNNSSKIKFLFWYLCHPD